MDTVSEGYSDEENEPVDPRIQIELNHLNVASTEINRLENEIDEARSKYRSIISETSNRMEVILRDQKRCIQKSREYYKLMGEAKIAQAEALKAARQYQTSTTIYKAAKETVALAECRLTEETDSTAAQLTSAWQEMLNHAIAKVTVAEREKTKSEQEHKRRAGKFAELESKIHVQEKKFTRSIKKSRPYFELKAELDIKLMQQKQNVNDLLAAIKSNKRKYQDTLRRLEKISEEIHDSRHEKFWSKVPRLPGVGAETDSIASTLSELGKESVGYESDLDSQLDTDKDDLHLELEFGGRHVNIDDDKTPVMEDAKDLDETLIGQRDKVSVSQTDTVGPDGAMNKADVGNIDDVKEPTNKDTIKLKDYCDTGAMAGGVMADESDVPAGRDDTGVGETECKSTKTHDKTVISDSIKTDIGACDVAVDDSKLTVDTHLNDTDASKAVLQVNREDSDDELTESFESCHEESGNSPDEKDRTNQVKGSAMDKQESIEQSNRATPDMATVERPSLSGAED